MKNPVLILAYLTILALQFGTIELLGTIAHDAARIVSFTIAIVFFTLGWLYLAIRVLTSRPRQTWRDHELHIEPARPNRLTHD